MQKTYQVVSPSGLSAKAASVLVGVFNKFHNIFVKVYHNNDIADGKSILSLITLVVKTQEFIIIEVDGVDAEQVFDLLNKTIKNQFPKILEEV